MSAYAKKSRFTELCSVCDRLCCETRDCISKGVKDDGIYCKYWQHSFAADLMFNLFELKTHVESLEAERDALRERCEKLERVRRIAASIQFTKTYRRFPLAANDAEEAELNVALAECGEGNNG